MTAPFPDRRDYLFGREPDVHHLVDRAALPGLTAIVARPLMGKTWTLTEVARRLREEDRHLVGYHESTGGESSHLLYAVSSLYSRWLADSTMREQAISLWHRHKGELVPRIGQLVGTLFEKLGAKVAPEAVTGVVREVFHGLAEAQKDLLSGGLHLPALPYDEALSLTRLVAKVSKRRVVLILDAWEKSPSLRAEIGTLEGILKHADDWGHAHLFLAVRHPEVDSTRLDEDAFLRARDLCRVNRAAEFYELRSMNLTDSRERQRIVAFVRGEIRGAQDRSEQEILGAIEGYPGVLNFWKVSGTHSVRQTWDDLAEEARDAQALRYSDFNHLLGGLKEGPRALAARLAFFPRLDAERWALFRDILLADQRIALVDMLIDRGVLIDEEFPSYGHDTRHVAARRWFIEHYRPLMRRTAEACVEALAARITGVNPASAPCAEALIGCSEAAQQVEVNSIARCLLDAAQAASGDTDNVSNGDFDEAYPNVVGRDPSFASLIAMALNNRAIARRRGGDVDRSIADYTAVLELPQVSAEQVALALCLRGLTRPPHEREGSIADFAAALELPNAPVRLVAMAFFLRGVARDEHGDEEGAIADYTAVIELPNAPVDLVTRARYTRGAIRSQRGDTDGAITDYTAVIELPDAPVEHVAKALKGRGICRAGCGEIDEAIADYTVVIELRNAPVDQVAQALNNRGVIRGQRGDSDGEIADYTAVIELPNAPVEALAQALCNRGIGRRQRGDIDGEIADYTAVIELPNAPVDQLALAFNNRGISRGERGDIEGEISDYTAVIELPNAPVEQVANALNNRAITRTQRGDTDGAIADYTTVIELPDAPAEQVAQALYNRGAMRYERGDIDGAIADLTAATEIRNAPVHVTEAALMALDQLRNALPPPEDDDHNAE